VGEDGASVCDDGVVARAAAVESRGLRRRGTPADPVGRGTPAVPAGRRGGTTGGGRGHPLFVPGEGDEQGKGKGREEMGRGLGRGRGRSSGRLL
jgi:hypothetical protein